MGKSYLTGAVTEVTVPSMADIDVSVYSITTRRDPGRMSKFFEELDFVSSRGAWSFDPKIIDISGGVSEILGMFSGLAKPEVLVDTCIRLPSEGSGSVKSQIAHRYPYMTTRETGPDGRERVRQQMSTLSYGVSHYFEVPQIRDGRVYLKVTRDISSPTDRAEVGPGRGHLRLEHRSLRAECSLRAHEAMVSVSLIRPDMRSKSSSGEIILSIISARKADLSATAEGHLKTLKSAA